ncbi:MAG: asparagine--tRNA ligase [Candidatus Babeliales bacterium]
MRLKISQLKESDIGSTVTVKGWVRTIRDQKSFAFCAVYDGSCFAPLQVVLQNTISDYDQLIKDITTGTSVAVTGQLIKSPGKGQAFELQATDVEIIGMCDQEYPLQKKQHSFEFLRTIAHLRPRTNTFGAVARVRSALAFATHTFFQQRGFLYVHTPIVTAADCEGAGEMFRVTTLPENNPPLKQDKTVDTAQDFFGRSAFLTVSGQLNGEAYACAVSDIYTFGPTFRAENSNTSRHLAEFWMIEPEMAFADIVDDMDCAESYIKFLLQWVLEKCPADMEFFDKFISNGLIERLRHVVNSPFERLTYTEAIEILLKADKKFAYPVVWGCDLQSEHERYLAEEYCKRPVIVRNYPQGIKAFYMRLNEDNKTVAAMDVLCPGIGEIIGGSQREERYDVLVEKMKAIGLNPEQYWWYLDLRKYGTVQHAGFGLGFERMVQYATGMENIRDVIPFPRYPGHADF